MGKDRSIVCARAWEKAFFGFLLALIHLICDLSTWMYVQYQILRRKLQRKNCKADFKRIKSLSQHQLTKIPQHIALVFMESELELTQVASLIIWCVASGCQYLSLYDALGSLKRQQVELIAKLSLLSESLENDDKLHLSWMNNEKTGNGRAVNNNSVQISLLSREDGQADIVRSAQALARANVPVNEEAIEERLNRMKVDPELLLRFGLARSNQGYPPWQIRLSEIHDLDSHHCGPDQFSQVLLKYSRCEQRFGR